MALRILSIDDELDMSDLILQKFRKKIRNNELEFLFAHNGIEALKIIEDNKDINIILADINMPKMDGLEFLRRLKLNNNPLKHVIMVSAYGDMKNIRTAMNLGAFDFVTKPIDFDDLELTIEKTRHKIIIMQHQHNEMKRLTTIENEVKAAGKIQASILPDISGQFKNYNSVQVSTFIKAALLVGGDLYDVYALDEKNVGFLIADVSGKGIIAASFMLRSHTAFKIYANQNLEPNKVLANVNNYLVEDNEESMFTTTFYAVLNTETGILSYCNGGHNPPYILRNNETIELPCQHSPALGIIKGVDYKTNTIQLQEGDLFLSFTDGVSEAQNTNNELFGEERITNFLKENKNLNPSEINTQLYSSINEFCGDTEQFDDITILSFRWN